MIDALVALGVPRERVGRMAGYPGVWIDPAADGPGDGPRKIAAVGVRTARGRTTHGFATQCRRPTSRCSTTSCRAGSPNNPMTSLAAEGSPVTMAEAVDAVIAAAGHVWGPTRRRGRGDRRRRAPPRRPAVPAAVVQVTVRRERPAGDALERRMARSGVDPAAGSRCRPASRSGCGSGRPWPTTTSGSSTTPRPRPGHRVRGGRLSQHLRVLVRRDGHVHDQRVAVHPGLWVLSGGHPSSPAPRRRRACPGGRGGGPDGPRPRGDHLRGPRRPADGGAGAFAATIAPIRDAQPGHRGRGAHLGPARATRASLGTDPRRPTRRPQPQHRDGGPAPAGGPAVGRLRPQPRPCWPARRMPGSPPSRGSSSAWGSGRTRCSPPWPTSGRWGSTSSPSASTCGRAPSTCRWPAGGPRRSSTTCAAAGDGDGVRPRPGLAADPLELPRPRGG